MARRRARSFVNKKQRGRRRLSIGTGAGASAAGGGVAGGEGIAGFNFLVTADTTPAQNAIADADSQVEDLASGTSVGPGGKRHVLPLGERLESGVRRLNARLSKKFGIDPAGSVSGGARKSFLEFGAEGVRVGDLRLSRSGLSLSEKTFVGSKVLGFAAVAGQLTGHVIRAAASYNEIVRAHEGLPSAVPGEVNDYTASKIAHARTLGDIAVGGAFKIATQAAAVFGGRELGGLVLHGFRQLKAYLNNSPDHRSLSESISAAQGNQDEILAALDFPTILAKYRERSVNRQLARIREKQQVRALWDGVRNDEVQRYASDTEQADVTLRSASYKTIQRLKEFKDVRGRALLDAAGGEMEGR